MWDVAKLHLGASSMSVYVRSSFIQVEDIVLSIDVRSQTLNAADRNME